MARSTSAYRNAASMKSARAIASALDLQPTWGEEVGHRERLVTELGALLDQFAGDFAKLISRETGKDAEVARDEVARAVVTLREASCAGGGGAVQAVCSNAVNPLLSAVEGMVRAWTGATPSSSFPMRSPSVLFALAELSARAEFPAGAFCLLHGDGATQLALERALGG